MDDESFFGGMGYFQSLNRPYSKDHRLAWRGDGRALQDGDIGAAPREGSLFIMVTGLCHPRGYHMMTG